MGFCSQPSAHLIESLTQIVRIKQILGFAGFEFAGKI
jgi:hypothetical protein